MLSRPLALAVAATVSLLSLNLVAHAAPFDLSNFATEWASVTPTHVSFDATAQEGNFGAPATISDTTSYDVYVRDDGTYYYIGLHAATPSPGLLFANLYLGNNTDTSYLGFEATNSRAFVPGGDGTYYPYTNGTSGIFYADNAGSGDDTIEMAIPNTFFSTNPLGIPTLPNSDTDMELRLSQSFGYSVAGGTANYGPLDLGTASVAVTPEPASLALLSSGALLLLKRRRR